jgi:hypothetical protein
MVVYVKKTVQRVGTYVMLSGGRLQGRLSMTERGFSPPQATPF